MFRMQPRKYILNIQKIFVHLMNHLKALGKTLTNDKLNLKVLRSLTREWQSKVKAILEKKNLSNMSSATLFGKLQEYETELGRLAKHENQEKKIKRHCFDGGIQGSRYWRKSGRRWKFDASCKKVR